MERDKGIYMSKNGQFIYQAVSDFLNGKLSRKQTAELLQVRKRSVTRLAKRIQEKGLFGVIHGNRDKVPVNKKANGLKTSVIKLVELRQNDFVLVFDDLRSDDELPRFQLASHSLPRIQLGPVAYSNRSANGTVIRERGGR